MIGRTLVPALPPLPPQTRRGSSSSQQQLRAFRSSVRHDHALQPPDVAGNILVTRKSLAHQEGSASIAPDTHPMLRRREREAKGKEVTQSERCAFSSRKVVVVVVVVVVVPQAPRSPITRFLFAAAMEGVRKLREAEYLW
ncbi:hypothetical protein E2C01_003735 [Portunus trituberculatus]|uniref:Uncharacterized protein n=1 Tax=Portunus trituberculatus TaxID=210409 RepID=A0A5B7CUC0_PORTR|nr:hypothetical protein [Portunus trituberculatus]